MVRATAYMTYADALSKHWVYRKSPWSKGGLHRNRDWGSVDSLSLISIYFVLCIYFVLYKFVKLKQNLIFFLYFTDQAKGCRDNGYRELPWYEGGFHRRYRTQDSGSVSSFSLISMFLYICTYYFFIYNCKIFKKWCLDNDVRSRINVAIMSQVHESLTNLCKTTISQYKSELFTKLKYLLSSILKHRLLRQSAPLIAMMRNLNGRKSSAHFINLAFDTVDWHK